jgi:hypothetical protein
VVSYSLLLVAILSLCLYTYELAARPSEHSPLPVWIVKNSNQLNDNGVSKSIPEAPQFDLSINNEFSKQSVEGYFSASDQETLSYKEDIVDGQLCITPTMSYLDKLQAGGPIAGLSYAWCPFKWQFPNLDVKIVNNTEKTAFFTQARFEIDKSTYDPKPILVIPDHTLLCLMLINEGWGEVIDCSLEFNIIPPDQNISFGGNYTYQESIGSFQEQYIIDLSDKFRSLGVNLEKIGDFRYLPQSLGPFKDGSALVYGEITYSEKTIEGKTEKNSLKFYTTVSFSSGASAPMPPSFYYQAMFSDWGDNYEIRVPLSQYVRPSEVDRFNILIGAPRSSVHQFRLRLESIDGTSLVSPPITLNIFVPRSQAGSLRKAS